MEKILMLLLICVTVGLERALSDSIPCTTEMDQERDTLMNGANCGSPKDVFVEIKREQNAAHEEIFPSSVWVKRCVGLCSHHGSDSKCEAKEIVTRQIPIKIVNLKTSKESCAQHAVEEHRSCQCCGDSHDSCTAAGRVFNPRKCGCQYPNIEKRHACLSKRSQNMRSNRSKCTCEARRRIKRGRAQQDVHLVH